MVSLLLLLAIPFVLAFAVGFVLLPLVSLAVSPAIDGKGLEGLGRLQWILAAWGFGSYVMLPTPDGEYTIRAADRTRVDGEDVLEFEYDGVTFRDGRTERLSTLGLRDFGVVWLPIESELAGLRADALPPAGEVDPVDLAEMDPDEPVRLDRTQAGHDLFVPADLLRADDLATTAGGETDPEDLAVADGGASTVDRIRVSIGKYLAPGPNPGASKVVSHPEDEALRRAGPMRLSGGRKVLIGLAAMAIGVTVGLLGSGVIG